MSWELQGFGSCIADWLNEEPPIAWRRPVNRWLRRLKDEPTYASEREPALDHGEWSAWFSEIPGAGDAHSVVVAYFRVHNELPIVRCVQMTTLPRFHE